MAAQKKTALIVYGGWDGHQPVQCKDVFVPWLTSRGFNVIASDSMDIYADAEKMSEIDVILPLWTMGSITHEQRNGLCEAVLKGAGLAGWHGGMCDAFRSDTEYQFMTGGQWVAHPGGIIPYKVNIAMPNDAVVKGLNDFSMNSEQYYMHTDPGNTVLATTTFTGRRGNARWIKGTVMPVVWKRMYGKGRVFYSSLGHVAADFQAPEAFEIMKRGIQWAARLPVRSEFRSPQRAGTWRIAALKTRSRRST